MTAVLCGLCEAPLETSSHLVSQQTWPRLPAGFSSFLGLFAPVFRCPWADIRRRRLPHQGQFLSYRSCDVLGLEHFGAPAMVCARENRDMLFSSHTWQRGRPDPWNRRILCGTRWAEDQRCTRARLSQRPAHRTASVWEVVSTPKRHRRPMIARCHRNESDHLPDAGV